jgi:replicative DNA helicase
MIEVTILSGLIHNEEYTRKVIPYIKDEYFQNVSDRIVLRKISKYLSKYNKIPNAESLLVELENDNSLSEADYKSCATLITTIKNHKETHDTEWLLDQTEQFCQDKAVYNAIMQSIHIIDGKSKKTKDGIPAILSEALGVCFDNNVGHDFLQDYNERFEYYHAEEEKIPFHLEYLNKITNGGVPKKTINIILAGTGVGKTLIMCDFAAHNLMSGRNVLYITNEMAEEKIAERIDANLMNVCLNDLKNISKSNYETKINKIMKRTVGKLIIKEYPTGSAHAGHFRHLINELKVKKGFVPDIIYIDYLNICASSRMRMGGSINTYSYIKSIAEELRGLAIEKNLPIWTATQTTRSGYSNSDPDLTDTSESFGLPATADLMIAAISTEEFEENNQIMIKQLKNRYGDPTRNRRFMVGIDKNKMKLFDIENQIELINSGPQQPANSQTDTQSQFEKFRKKDFTSLFN